jgi:hypothetical protein
MRTWRELDNEFRALAPRMEEARLDVQWGAAGVHCHLRGFVGTPVRIRFESLASIAGAKLQSHPSVRERTAIRDAPSGFEAWALGLKELSGAFNSNLVGEQISLDGQKHGLVFGGTVSGVADVSANLCLALDAASADFQVNIAAIPGADEHLRKSQAFLLGDPPDLANAAKEAVSALESVARHRCGAESATLGECLKQLRDQKRLHPALAQTLEKVWGFVNQSPGIRHGGTVGPNVTHAEAAFVVRACEAGIELLVAVV